MRKNIKLYFCFFFCVISFDAVAQTDWSLFLRADSILVNEISTEEAEMYRMVGHHGPAVENRYAAFRIYYNDSGAIDLYSKSGLQMELRKYKWYPTGKEQSDEGAGVDEYFVGKTVGCGGVALWDGAKEIRLCATNGRTAHAGRTVGGAFAEIISYGVICNGEFYDISVRVDVFDDSRVAIVTASELRGRKVCFLTGINCHEGQTVSTGKNYIAVWGAHPADVSKAPMPIGAGMTFHPEQFGSIEKIGDMIRIISLPSAQIRTGIITGSSKEKENGTASDFFTAVKTNQLSQ